MARTSRIEQRKQMESDMRRFGDEMTTWEDTHSEFIDESESFRKRYRELSDRLQIVEGIGEDQLDDYLQGVRRDLSSLVADYERARSARSG